MIVECFVLALLLAATSIETAPQGCAYGGRRFGSSIRALKPRMAHGARPGRGALVRAEGVSP
jgi:hypothetical protein